MKTKKLKTKVKPAVKQTFCDSCGKNPAQEIHGCPYQSEINDDCDFTCDCCDDCRGECCMAI